MLSHVSDCTPFVVQVNLFIDFMKLNVSRMIQAVIRSKVLFVVVGAYGE